MHIRQVPTVRFCVHNGSGFRVQLVIKFSRRRILPPNVNEGIEIVNRVLSQNEGNRNSNPRKDGDPINLFFFHFFQGFPHFFSTILIQREDD